MVDIEKKPQSKEEALQLFTEAVREYRKTGRWYFSCLRLEYLAVLQGVTLEETTAIWNKIWEEE